MILATNHRIINQNLFSLRPLKQILFLYKQIISILRILYNITTQLIRKTVQISYMLRMTTPNQNNHISLLLIKSLIRITYSQRTQIRSYCIRKLRLISIFYSHTKLTFIHSHKFMLLQTKFTVLPRSQNLNNIAYSLRSIKKSNIILIKLLLLLLLRVLEILLVLEEILYEYFLFID